MVEATYGPGGKPPPKHLHPSQDERFRVLEGRLRLRVGISERELGAGDEIEIPRGVAAPDLEPARRAGAGHLDHAPGRAHRALVSRGRRAGARRARRAAIGGPLSFAALLDEYGDSFRLAVGPEPLVGVGGQGARRVGRARLAGQRRLRRDEVRRRLLPHRRRHRPGDARADGRAAPVRVAVLHRPHPHPRLARDPVPGRDRAAARVLAHPRPVRRPDGRRRGDRADQARHRGLPGDRARPDRDREAGRRASTGSRAGGCCSASAPAGTSRRCATTAPTPAGASAVMRERVEAIKEIWTSDEATYHGEHVDFDRIWCWPKPLADPHPPIIVGGHGKRVLDRVLAYGDEWMPNRIGDDGKISARIARLRQAGEDAGRGPIPTTLANATTDPEVLELYESSGRAPGAVLGRPGRRVGPRAPPRPDRRRDRGLRGRRLSRAQRRRAAPGAAEASSRSRARAASARRAPRSPGRRACAGSRRGRRESGAAAGWSRRSRCRRRASRRCRRRPPRTRPRGSRRGAARPAARPGSRRPSRAAAQARRRPRAAASAAPARRPRPGRPAPGSPPARRACGCSGSASSHRRARARSSSAPRAIPSATAAIDAASRPNGGNAYSGPLSRGLVGEQRCRRGRPGRRARRRRCRGCRSPAGRRPTRCRSPRPRPPASARAGCRAARCEQFPGPSPSRTTQPPISQSQLSTLLQKRQRPADHQLAAGRRRRPRGREHAADDAGRIAVDLGGRGLSSR